MPREPSSTPWGARDDRTRHPEYLPPIALTTKGCAMTSAHAMKESICQAIDRQDEKSIAIGETIRRHPELDFKEFKTARLVEETLGGLGLTPKGGLAITGVRAEARGATDGPTFALLAELDGLVVAGHPVADPPTRGRKRTRLDSSR